MRTVNGTFSSDSERSELRADARRNQTTGFARCAREVFVEFGADAPLDDVARRAGVGIAALYPPVS